MELARRREVGDRDRAPDRLTSSVAGYLGRMTLTPAERVLRSKMAAHRSWANTEDRTARTAKARQAAADRFEKQIDPEGKLPTEERAKRAESARKAFYAEMAFKSARSRRRNKAAKARSEGKE